MPDTADRVIRRLDELVDRYCRRTRFFNEPISMGRARTWVMQHRLNTRQRNLVLKLRVATNCPDWDVRLQVVGACADEVVADEKYGHGKPHWLHLEELGMSLGMKREEVQNAKPLDSTLICWAAWEGLMSNRHWLEGVVANNAAVPSAADGANAGWNTIARHAHDLHMEDEVAEACRRNLLVWTLYFDGIADAGDKLESILKRAREPGTLNSREPPVLAALVFCGLRRHIFVAPAR